MASEECSSLSDSEESGLSTPPPKKRCGHAQKGAATYKTAYNPEWAKSYPVSVVNGNNYAFYCVPCKKNVQCGHMGIGDVKQHCRSALHRKMEAAIKSSRSLLTYSSASSSSDLSEKTIKAEVLPAPPPPRLPCVPPCNPPSQWPWLASCALKIWVSHAHTEF